MLVSIIYIVLGFILLIWSADEFTKNSVKIANIFNISPLIIGILIFGFGTSAPEMLVSGLAAYNGHPDLSIGNAFGSNILNIALVLGITAIILPIKVRQEILKKEWLYLMVVTLITGVLIADGDLSLTDGFILLLLLALFLIYSFIYFRKSDGEELYENCVEIKPKENKYKVWLILIISLPVLLIGANLVVSGGSELAAAFGVSDLLIGLTVFALGTSLPELAVSISSALKKQHEMIVGNIIGSNLFNTLGVLPIAIIISPFEVSEEILNRDYPVMIALTILLFIFAYKFKQQGVISRLNGALLILTLTAYFYLLF